MAAGGWRRPFRMSGPQAVLMAMVETAIARLPDVYPRATAASIRCRRFHWGRGQQELLGGANSAGVVVSKSGGTSRLTRCRDNGFRMSSGRPCLFRVHTASAGCIITVSLCEPKQQPSYIALTACSRPRCCCGDTAKGPVCNCRSHHTPVHRKQQIMIIISITTLRALRRRGPG